MCERSKRAATHGALAELFELDVAAQSICELQQLGEPDPRYALHVAREPVGFGRGGELMETRWGGGSKVKLLAQAGCSEYPLSGSLLPVLVTASARERSRRWESGSLSDGDGRTSRASIVSANRLSLLFGRNVACTISSAQLRAIESESRQSRTETLSTTERCEVDKRFPRDRGDRTATQEERKTELTAPRNKGPV